MYNWRHMTEEQRQYVLTLRKTLRNPWHSPPHRPPDGASLFHITAACYEHRPIIGYSDKRMLDFEERLLDTLTDVSDTVNAWAILPNHYHVLVDAPDIRVVLKRLGRLHGRTSYDWNGDENRRGRQVWHNAAEHRIKSERHFQVALNYIHNNPVRHRYVTRWQDWPFSSARDYLDALGRPVMIALWRDHPILDYGRDWDPPEL